MSRRSNQVIVEMFLLLCLSKLLPCYKLLANYDILTRSSLSPSSLNSLNSVHSVRPQIWTNGVIPYQFHRTFDKWGQSEVRSAMDYLEKITCVKFIDSSASPSSSLSSSGKDFVLISQGKGCSSEIGKAGGKQDLYLDTPYCIDKGTVLHELLHTLGMIHEHARPDRDNYVQINWPNIDEKHKVNFEIAAEVAGDYYLNEPYDYESLMHYSTYMYAIDGTVPTIYPKDGSSVSIENLGSHLKKESLSPQDIYKLRKLYNCQGN